MRFWLPWRCLTQANPRSRPQSCLGVILVTDMDHHPLAVNNDSRQSCLTGSYWSPSCILLVTTLKDAYFEELNHMEGKKNHNATYKSRSRESLKSQVNSLVRDSSIHGEGEWKYKRSPWWWLEKNKVILSSNKYFLNYGVTLPSLSQRNWVRRRGALSCVGSRGSYRSTLTVVKLYPPNCSQHECQHSF